MICTTALLIANVAAQTNYDWAENPPPKDLFASVLSQILAASAETNPFSSITGRYDPERNQLSPKVYLPGMQPELCGIKQSIYTCRTPKGPSGPEQRSLSEARVKKAFVNLVNVLQDVRPDLHIYFSPGSAERMQTATFDGPPGAKWGSISITRVSDYMSVSFRGAHSAGSTPVSSAQSTPIDTEIANVVSSGKFASLPPAQSSVSDNSKGQTDVTVAITNSTSFSLRILTAGPSSHEYTIVPGATENIKVAPGAYKLLGRVASPSVLPFYGEARYSSGTSYSYRFYIR